MKIDDYFLYKDGSLFWKTSTNRRIKVGDKAGTPDFKGYLQVTLLGKIYRVHQIVFYLHFGWFPKQIDHINGNKLDNRIENLRPATCSQNLANRPKKKNCTSRFKGVYFNKSCNKWCARFFFNSKVKHIGLFEKEEDAALAYNQKALEVFGDYAKLNKV